VHLVRCQSSSSASASMSRRRRSRTPIVGRETSFGRREYRAGPGSTRARSSGRHRRGLLCGTLSSAFYAYESRLGAQGGLRALWIRGGALHGFSCCPHRGNCRTSPSSPWHCSIGQMGTKGRLREIMRARHRENAWTSGGGQAWEGFLDLARCSSFSFVWARMRQSAWPRNASLTESRLRKRARSRMRSNLKKKRGFISRRLGDSPRMSPSPHRSRPRASATEPLHDLIERGCALARRATARGQ